MTLYRIQASIQAKTQLSKDRYVSSFHVNGPTGASVADLTAIAGEIQAFYNNATVSGQSVSHYMSPSSLGEVSHIKAYRLEDPKPRSPVIDISWSLAASSAAANGLPAEVAACLSYNAEPIPGVLHGRLRGRIYIGPLATNTLSEEATTMSVRPSITFRNDLLASGARLATNIAGIAGGTYRWVVHSPTTGELTGYTITRLTVDDAFDTQRRRGVAPTSRVSMAVPIVG